MEPTIPSSVDENACRRFEAAWHTERPEPIEDCLPPEQHPLYRATLEELILIEMELAWKRYCESNPGAPRPARAEDYLKRFPQLDRAAALRLLRQEFLLRHRLGDTVAPDEMRIRFPDIPSEEGEHLLDFSDVASPSPQPAAAGARPVDHRFLRPPESLGEIGRLAHYRVQRVLGAGGMGIVFLAEDPQLKRRVALKVLRPDLATDSDSRRRFLREAQAVASIEHDHIIAVYQVDEDQGVPFFTMPLLRGETVADRLKRAGRLPISEVLRIGREAAEGLRAAHERGLMHRDIKPANLWLEEGNQRVKLLDFGLARGAGAGADLTHPGTVLGTPAYMAPEQARSGVVDARCDLFSLGCVLYELCTGQRPFRGADPVAVLLAVSQDTPTPPEQINSAIPLVLSDLVMKLLAKDPDRRYPSARALIEALRDIETGLASDDPTPTVPIRTRGINRRWKLTFTTAAVLLLALLAVGAWLWTRGSAGSGKDGPDRSKEPPPDLFRHLALDHGKLLPWHPEELVAVVGDERARHWGPIVSLACSVDGKWLVSAGRDRTVRLWNAKTLEPAGLVALGPRGVRPSLAFAPDNQTVVIAAGDPHVLLWDVTTPLTRPRRFPEAHPGGASAVAISPDGKHLAIGGEDGLLRVWEDWSQAKPSRKAEFPAPAVQKAELRPLHDLVFCANNRLLVAACGDGSQLRLWDLGGSDPQEKKPLVPKHPVRGLSFAPDGTFLMLGDTDWGPFNWNLNFEQPFGLHFLQKEPVRSLVGAPNGRSFAVATAPDRIYLFGWDDGVSLRASGTIPGPPVTAVALVPDGAVFSGDEAGLLRSWSRSREKLVENPSVRQPMPLRRISPAGVPEVLTQTHDAGVKRWDLGGATPRELGSVPGNPKMPAVALGSKRAALAGPLEVVVWDVERTPPRPRFELPRDQLDQVRTVELSADDNLLATAGASLRLWDIAEDEARARGRPLTWLPEGPVIVRFAVDGSTVAAAAKDGAAVWDIRTETPTVRLDLRKPGAGPIAALALSGDGARLGIGSANELTVWELASGREMTKPRGKFDAPVSAVALSPAGDLVAGATVAGEVKVWSVEPAAEIHSWTFPGSVADIVFTPDGRYLITANGNGSVYLLRLKGATD